MDGYVLMEINPEGDMRVQEIDGSMELHYIDFRLQVLEIDADFIRDCLERNLEGITDALVMVFFTYESVSTGGGDYWSFEYEDNLIYQSHTVVKEGYKAFYRMLVSEELQLQEVGFGDDRYYNHIVAHWEEFYDEEFVPWEPKKKNWIQHHECKE